MYGEEINLLSATGVIRRVVVSWTDKHVTVCRRKEFEAAKAQKRDPVTVAFRISDVIPDDPAAGGATK